mgnify:CR=1 FL=1
MSSLSPTPTVAHEQPSVITSVVVCQTGEARGHGVWIDRDFVEALIAEGNHGLRGIKARFGHALPGKDPVGTEIGRFRQFRLVYDASRSIAMGQECWSAVADLHLAPTAHNASAIAHLTGLAETDPGLIGASIEFRPGVPTGGSNPWGLPHETLAELFAIAITSDPACVDGGLVRVSTV